MAKSNKLSIYKIKEGFYSENQILKSFTTKKTLDGIGDFYYSPSVSYPPGWLENFFNNQIADSTIFSAGSRGVLIVKINYEGAEVIFAIPFGLGVHMIIDEAIEERFGLRVTLNSVLAESIRSIEKRTLGANPKISKEQMGKAAKASEFGIDIEQDLIRAVTGKSKITDLSKIISGADVLSVTAPADITTIKEYLIKCYERYLSEDYKENFDWIDQIQEIKTKSIVDKLNGLLIDKLNRKELDRIWMAVPDLIDWTDVKGFKFLPRQREFSPDIDIEEFVESFSDAIDDIKKIKVRTVTAFSEKTGDELTSWTAYKCLYGELEHEDKQYMLNYGKWYEINNNFVDSVNADYASINASSITLPDFNHDNEGKYTADVCDQNDLFINMDKDVIIHGGGKSSIEFCDIYTLDKKIIHIKPYSASSVLSHLFQQGLVSGEHFVSDVEFRRKLNTKVNNKLKTGWTRNTSVARPNPSEYEVVYAIISSKGDAKPVIPFFSRVSIKNARRRLEGFGYTVTILKIQSVK